MARIAALAPARRMRLTVFPALIAAVAVASLAALALGPVQIAPERVLATLLGEGGPAESAILWQIRMPRLLLGLAVGTALALSGAALQGLLRNPLAEPAVIGVTSGAAVGAVGTIVLGGVVAEELPAALRPFLLPAAAFCGAGLVILFVFAVARRRGETSIATLILSGVAVTAIANAMIGAMIFLSDDQQLRELTLWTLGGLSTAGWPMAAAAALLAAVTAPVFLLHARTLDLFQLGERAAFHSGVDVEAAKLALGVATAIAVGAATAAAGPIAFVGLVAPHVARLLVGPSHRTLLPATALLGVALVLLADLTVRMAAPPAEPPIGLATSLLGGPFFLWLLLRKRGGLHA